MPGEDNKGFLGHSSAALHRKSSSTPSTHAQNSPGQSQQLPHVLLLPTDPPASPHSKPAAPLLAQSSGLSSSLSPELQTPALRNGCSCPNTPGVPSLPAWEHQVSAQLCCTRRPGQGAGWAPSPTPALPEGCLGKDSGASPRTQSPTQCLLWNQDTPTSSPPEKVRAAHSSPPAPLTACSAFPWQCPTPGWPLDTVLATLQPDRAGDKSSFSNRLQRQSEGGGGGTGEGYWGY